MHTPATGHAWQMRFGAWYILFFVSLLNLPRTRLSTSSRGHLYVSLSG